MDGRLYVGNVADDVSSETLRRLFADFGTVTDVTLVTDRQSGRARGHAFVTMSSPAEAKAAIDALNGTDLDDRRLRVNLAGDREPSAAKAQAARVTFQFRERHNMTYELDCAGTALSIKMFPEDSDERSWRIDASLRGAEAEGVVVSASAPTRGDALDEVARIWVAKTGSRVDWAAVKQALAAVRAT